jgi:signal transduction histidine kinase
MTGADQRLGKRRQIWRTLELAMVVLGVGLNVVGLTTGLERARALRIFLIEQAKPRARQIAADARSLLDVQVSAALRSVAESERWSVAQDYRWPGQRPPWLTDEPWAAGGLPEWIDGVYIWDGQSLSDKRPASRQPEAIAEAVARCLSAAPAATDGGGDGDRDPDRVEYLHGTIDGRPLVLAALPAHGVRHPETLVLCRIHLEQLKRVLVQPMLELTHDLEIVTSADTDQPWSQAMSGAMRWWKIKPTAAFLAEQTHTAIWQFAGYFGLMLLSLVTLLAALWYLTRVTRREIALAEMKSNFVADVSHELKTPLSLIRLFGETLQSGRVKEETKRQEYYSVITRESTRLTNLINNILDFAGIDAGKKEYSMRRIDIGELVRETYEAYRLELDHQGFTHFLHVRPDLPLIDADRDAIARAILNLISNAIKYSGEECYLNIDLRKETRRGRHGVLISVEDHGIGIRPEDRVHLFEGFFRSTDRRVRGERGAGLGLGLVKHIVDAHKGHLDVESRLVKGSTFRIFLPEGVGPSPTGGAGGSSTDTATDSEAREHL